MKFWAWGAAIGAIGAIGSTLGACGGGGTSGAGGGAGGAGMSSGSSSATTSSSSGVVVGAECAMKPTKQDCFTCCETDLDAANNLYIADLVGACACNTPDGGSAPPCAGDAMCQMECTTMMINQGCLNCVNGLIQPPDGGAQDPCLQVGVKACVADPMCGPLLDCSKMYCKQAM